MAAEVLSYEMEKIQLIIGDTDHCSETGFSAASRITYVVVRSIQMAGQNLKRLLQKAVAPIIRVPKEDLVFENGFSYPQ